MRKKGIAGGLESGSNPKDERRPARRGLRRRDVLLGGGALAVTGVRAEAQEASTEVEEAVRTYVKSGGETLPSPEILSQILLDSEWRVYRSRNSSAPESYATAWNEHLASTRESVADVSEQHREWGRALVAMKSAYEERLGINTYNKDQGLMFGAMFDNPPKINCDSATQLFMATAFALTGDVVPENSRLVYIYKNAHVLPGYVDGDGKLYGIEATVIGGPSFDRGFIGDLNQMAARPGSVPLMRVVEVGHAVMHAELDMFSQARLSRHGILFDNVPTGVQGTTNVANGITRAHSFTSGVVHVPEGDRPMPTGATGVNATDSLYTFAGEMQSSDDSKFDEDAMSELSSLLGGVLARPDAAHVLKGLTEVVQYGGSSYLAISELESMARYMRDGPSSTQVETDAALAAFLEALKGFDGPVYDRIQGGVQ